MWGNSILARIAELLGEVGGRYVFDHEGAQYVVMKLADLEREGPDEVQMPLESGNEVDDAVLQEANRDIALEQSSDEPVEWRPAVFSEERRVSFEPLRGDLPPELQE